MSSLFIKFKGIVYLCYAFQTLQNISMREAAFIKENKDKWLEIENQTANKDISAENLAENFVELTDDLAYARTFYPQSQTVRYLNRLTGGYFIDIYQYRKKQKNRLITFWTTELPLIMYKHRKCMLYSFLTLFVGVLLGVFSQSQDSSFADNILGPDYVNMTIDNIESGDPMAVYKSSDEAPMFFMISTNNIRVAFIAFIFGIFLSVGTAYILFSNGVMLGTFQYFFYDQDLLWTSVASIWLHGTLEISAIVIAGGAGFIIGNSILFPGNRKRIISLQNSAKDALKIAVGLIPVFIVAAFIESFWTRLTDLPIIFNIVVIGASALFILWYFFLYPSILNKNLNGKQTEN